MQFTGAFTALVTPFKNGEIDEEAYRNFIEWQIEQGIDGLVPCGTTGEAATLTHAEQGKVISICVDQVKGRVPVIAGAGSNNTKEAINLTLMAKKAGADAALQITPYYNKPTTQGLIRHYQAISQESSLPIILYNVPGRTGLNVLPENLAKIIKAVPDVKGVKEATGSMRQATDIVEYCGQDFLLFSGDDFTALPLLAVGGCGVISVTANIMPAAMARMCHAFREGDIKTAQEVNLLLNPLHRAMFLETNPIPVKVALGIMGIIPPVEFRLPLCPLLPENYDRLKTALRTAGLF